ncbi:MAG: GyrI-like domain-containing protein [Bacteroidetes bacterium]|nr:GyrI-like domain-containing protein [Bacteroidota bacterium]
MPHREETKKDYHERINKVLLYINAHLEENLELEKLATVSNFSVFHFHRILRAHLNESVGLYIYRVRMDTAAKLISLTEMQINEIGWKVGYDTPSSFSKAFRKRFGVSPQEYRNADNEALNYNVSFDKSKTEIEMKTKIKELNEKRIIFIHAIGKYGDESISPAWDKLIDFAKKNRLFGWKTEFFGICHDDPGVTEEDKCRYDACITIAKEVKPEGEVGVTTISGGKYAIFRVKGSYEQLDKAYTYIFRTWLPESGYKLRDVPSLEKYLNSPKRTKPHKLQTEIYIPVE